MNFLTLSYFVELAKELSFSKTAHKLHMSQQTLSFHIQKLEEYYGTNLFIRKPQLKLSYAGEVLLQEAEDILKKLGTTMDRMAFITNNQVGKLHIGISGYPAKMILPDIHTKFREKWPNIRLVFPNKSMIERTQMIIDGKLDICIGIYNGNDSSIDTIDLFDDRLYLVISDALLLSHYGKEKADELKQSEKEATNLKAFSTLPYMLLLTSSHLGFVTNEYFSRMKIAPHIVMSSGSLDILEPMVIQGYGAFICGRMRANRILSSCSGMNAFPLAF